MTLLATARWTPVEGPGDDMCELHELADGWQLKGHAEFPGDLGWAALDYAVRLDHRWRTLTATVRGTHGSAVVDLTIQRAEFWTVNGEVQSGLGLAVDVDLPFTPATNLMPIRRLHSDPLHVQAAWLQFPLPELQRLDQVYMPMDDGRISYASPGFKADLTVDPSGFVTDYPDLWEGTVTHADAG